MIKKFIHSLIPPILFYLFDLLKYKFSKNKLFDGNSSLFEENLLSDHIYGEYGVGLSTLYAESIGVSAGVSIENDLEWLLKIKGNIKKTDSWFFQFIDCGDTYRWARPKNLEKRRDFLCYANAMWQQKVKPNFILIDGRFRVLCFLIALK